MRSFLDQIAYPPPMPVAPQPEAPVPPGYEYTPPPRGGSFSPMDLYRLGQSMAADNAATALQWLPQGVQRGAMQLASPPSHALGWPYPGFAQQAQDYLGIPQATGSPLLNWVLWGHSDPSNPLAAAHWFGGEPPPADDGWAR